MKKILVTGASGYIGRELIPHLVKRGYRVVALVRNAKEYRVHPSIAEQVDVVEGDLLDASSLISIPLDIDAAYYLVHAMATSLAEFEKLERAQAENFLEAVKESAIQQVIYLGGLVGKNSKLSRHLSSRCAVEKILAKSSIPHTVLRAGIILGSGSASFEIIRDLVEKLPFMVAPKWTSSKCQPIALEDMIYFLQEVLFDKRCYGKIFDAGGDEQLSYKEILYGYAKVRGLKRYILTIPLLTPKLSSYWLYFITSTNFSLAMALVDSLKIDAVCCGTKIQEVIPRSSLSFEESIRKSLEIGDQPPKFGSLTDKQLLSFSLPREEVVERIWSIGGNTGWYAYNWAWKLRGWIDQIVGGVGLRRGRDDPNEIHRGDHLDFWRVEVADKERGHLLLRAEMKVPGEAWLDFKVEENYLVQKATFRPKGLLGRGYWYLLLPLHLLIFKAMAKKLVSSSTSKISE